MVNDDLERNQLFTRRAFLLMSGKLGLLSILAGRMYYMQALRSNEYKTLSDKNRVSLITLYPPRGNIIDKNGKLIAISNENFRIILDRRENPNYKGSLEYLIYLYNNKIKFIRKLKKLVSKCQ